MCEYKELTRKYLSKYFPDAFDSHGLQVKTGIYYVYFLECCDGSIYVGYTNNLTARLLRHFTGNGARWVASRLPASLVGVENYKSKEDAMTREKELHGYTHERLCNILLL